MDPRHEYALLKTFQGLFDGKPYFHRDSTLGDAVAAQLYEDLVALGKSAKLVDRVRRHERVVNLKNVAIGKPARRGDGTFGELVPTALAVTEKGFLVGRGPIATIEIGAETKILAKAMIKQIDRVIGEFPTDGKKRKHPFQEAPEAEKRLLQLAKPAFDEFLIMKFQATNTSPYPFGWVNYEQTSMEYAALLTRVSREYDRRYA